MREQLDTIKHLYRLSGILVHPTSLPGEYGIGDLGPGVPFCRFSQRRRPASLANAASRSHWRYKLSVSVLFIFRRSASADQPGTSQG